MIFVSDLRYEGIQALTEFLNLVARVNLAVRGRNPEDVWRRLNAPDLNLEDLEAGRRDRYCEALLSALKGKEGGMLTHSELQAAVDRANDEAARAGATQMSEAAVVFLQSRARGFLVRQRLFAMLQHYYDREGMVVRAQAGVRGWLARRRWRGAIMEAARRRRPRLPPLSHYRGKEKSIVAIQRAWRQYKNKVRTHH